MISRVLVAAGLLCARAKESIEDELNHVKNNGGGSQDGSQSGNYQQYMKEYAGGSQGGSSGGYQKYMNQYAGKYMGGSGSQGGSQSGDYQHYYQQYMNLNAKDNKGGYQQYMKQYAGGQGGSSGGYQKYMNQYAGKYMGGSGSQGGSQSSDSSEMELLEQPAKKTSDSSMGSEVNLDAGEQPQQHNYQDYVKQYAGNYQQYMNTNNKECSKEIGSASDAKTKDQLDKWYKGAKLNVHCYVPKEDVKYSLSDTHKQYEKRLHELDATTESPLEANLELAEKPQSDQLVEKPQMDDKTQMAQKSAKTFLAKSEIAQSEVAANLALFADQVKSDPVTVVGMALLGVALACLVFFAVRHRRSSVRPVRLPVGMLG